MWCQIWGQRYSHQYDVNRSHWALCCWNEKCVFCIGLDWPKIWIWNFFRCKLPMCNAECSSHPMHADLECKVGHIWIWRVRFLMVLQFPLVDSERKATYSAFATHLFSALEGKLRREKKISSQFQGWYKKALWDHPFGTYTSRWVGGFDYLVTASL